MECSNLLFENNVCQNSDNKIRRKLQCVNKELLYNINVNTFTGDQIYEIIGVINYVEKTYRGVKIPLTINIGEIIFYDKLVYIILESICWNLIHIRQRKIKVLFNAKHTIWSEGISYSPMIYLDDVRKFEKKYVYDLYMRHFRRMIPCIEKGKEQYLSDLMQEISCFLENNGIEENTCSELSEVLSELVGNAGEHGDTECLIDIDITQDRYIKFNDDNNYYGMNAVIINYSPVLFYVPLKNKMSNQSFFADRYKVVEKAYENHKAFLD